MMFGATKYVHIFVCIFRHKEPDFIINHSDQYIHIEWLGNIVGNAMAIGIDLIHILRFCGHHNDDMFESLITYGSTHINTLLAGKHPVQKNNIRDRKSTRLNSTHVKISYD